MAELTLNGVTKRFGDGDGEILAVDDTSIEIADGEFLVLVGPSGCGKSTTLRMIAGLETISEGNIILDGEVINNTQPKDRDIAMVFQSYALYPHMTARENMSFGLEESTDLAGAAITERVEEAATTMGIEELLDRKPSELSGGQQQRIALGRAIVRDPSVFLLDEPLSNLDAKLRSQMRTELQRLQEELAVTTVYVTHDQTEAMTMGDRIAILNDGRLQQVGTPLECYHQPSNRFVADFIGEPSMNFFKVEHQGTRLVGERFEYPLSERTLNELEQSDSDTTTLDLGVRPEDIELVPEVDTDHDLETIVDVVEPRGDENSVYLTFDEHAEGKTFVASVHGLRTIDRGQSIIARIPEHSIHLFDRDSGQSLRNRRLKEFETAESLN